MTPGTRFRTAVESDESVLQCVGTTSAYHARMAEHCGFRSLYVSGSGVAASSCGMPDLAVTTMHDVLVDVRRIADVTDLPILVDIDTGWGGPFHIARTIRAMNRAGAAAVHVEDQVVDKRCGHLPGKEIVRCGEMIDRIKAAVDARLDESFVVMARTDALAVEGMQSTVDRIGAYVDAGADMIFPEAMDELGQYRTIAESCPVPILANMTEFGKTPLFTTDQLASAGVRIALYPLSAFRAASRAALEIYQTIFNQGTQASVVASMQSRDELYDFLEYHKWERAIDRGRLIGEDRDTKDETHG